jgi:hypothetical protein
MIGRGPFNVVRSNGSDELLARAVGTRAAAIKKGPWRGSRS